MIPEVGDVNGGVGTVGAGVNLASGGLALPAAASATHLTLTTTFYL